MNLLPSGWPSRFDRGQALDAALRLFWHHGYESVSIDDLIKAMGIARSTLYDVFGSKAELHRQAFARYGAGLLSAEDIAAASSARNAVETLLKRGVAAATRPDTPMGYMMSSGMLTAASEHADLAARLQKLRDEARHALQHRIARDVETGVLPETTDAEIEARFIFTVLQGLPLQALDGASSEDLTAVAVQALKHFPQPEAAAEGLPAR
ncbi:TetR/AcrR family transcriptional regulator [Novosphingobium terrae]|uniref:TetR/AcrR family transcriptional regulator n=1 Tax=Novosphingobium terrae TaxID=2726189 RepID=UPI00197CDA4F|nr:TetR/AcrR family transcriptional regulator [Novosphingobium terrae]